MGGEVFAGRFHSVVRGGAGSGWGKLVLISVGVRNGGPEAPPWSFQRLLLGSGGRLSFPVLCILITKLCPFLTEKIGEGRRCGIGGLGRAEAGRVWGRCHWVDWGWRRF